ncbi:MAG TPA: hypothetical protein VMA33_06400, partial [Candidatus Tectomicrobia bacterium]|nr:hypothetical protein [Candidatus Tectomicrobia bacterium]
HYERLAAKGGVEKDRGERRESSSGTTELSFRLHEFRSNYSEFSQPADSNNSPRARERAGLGGTVMKVTIQIVRSIHPWGAKK